MRPSGQLSCMVTLHLFTAIITMCVLQPVNITDHIECTDAKKIIFTELSVLLKQKVH